MPSHFFLLTLQEEEQSGSNLSRTISKSIFTFGALLFVVFGGNGWERGSVVCRPGGGGVPASSWWWWTGGVRVSP